MQDVLAQPALAQVALAERDDLDVGRGALDADHLDAELAELAEPARLRPSVPELRLDVVALERVRQLLRVRQVGAHDRRRALRAAA